MASVIRGSDGFDSSNEILIAPVFKAYKNVNQTLPDLTWTRLAFEVAEFDSNGSYNTSTGKFQPDIAGYYNIGACVAFLSGSFRAALSSVFKNGVEYSKLAYCYSTTSDLDDWAVSSSTLVYLNGTTDYCEIYAYLTGGGVTVNGTSGPEYTTFFGHLVRAGE